MKFPSEQALRLSTRASDPKKGSVLDRAQWASARVLFHTYVAFCMITVVGGFLTAPLMSWLFFGDWRVWRHWSAAKGLLPHSFRMLRHMIGGKNGGFMLEVPLSAPPATSVDHDQVEISPTWEFSNSCGPCNRCCSKLSCPVLDTKTGLCRGYDSFFWRYFNCGRYPTNQREIDYYICHKWGLKSESPSQNAPIIRKRKEQVA